MKRDLASGLVILLLALTMTGCEKSLTDDDSTANVKNANVVLQLTTFDELPFDTRSVQDIAQLCSHVNVAFFQGDTKVKTVSQKQTDSGFGTVSLALPEGTYQLVVIAHNCNGSATITSTEKVTFPSNIVTDSFYYYGTLTVGTSQTVYSLELHRMVSMFRLELTNTLPAQAAKIRFYYTGGSSTFSPLSGYGCVNSRQTVTMNVEPGQKVFEVYTMPHEEKDFLKIVITVYDANDNILIEQTFENVPVTRNRITRFTGDLFNSSGSPTGNSLSLKANGDWGNDESYTF